MGFEQLAALKEQLAAQAAEKRQQSRKPAPAGKPRSERPARDGKAAARPQRPAQRREQPDVDPVVLTISKLQRLYPKTFPKKPEPKVALKIGILQDLLAQADSLKLTEEEIRAAIKTWCEGSRYWSCMIEDAVRINLQGEAEGQVTAPEAVRAKQLSARRRRSAIQAAKGARQPGKNTGETVAAGSDTTAAAEPTMTETATPEAQLAAVQPSSAQAASDANAPDSDSTPSGQAATDSTESQ
ncbi:MAG: ProQ/FINO family protein [Corticimicrobacter sp.]|uniref:ProQ/FINO family protein n=1 Tax=Corticimicrobacter sp. TaxID=2678536 RepID=UPI0032DB4ADF